MRFFVELVIFSCAAAEPLTLQQRRRSSRARDEGRGRRDRRRVAERRGGWRAGQEVALGNKYPRRFGCVPPETKVVPVANDVRRGNLR